MSRQEQVSTTIDCIWREENDAVYQIRVPGGFLESSHTRHNNYVIKWIKSETPHHGVGRDLLFAALKHAQDLRAERIEATIVSRECLDVMEQVFGVDCIEVHARGAYAADAVAVANPGAETVAGLELYLS